MWAETVTPIRNDDAAALRARGLEAAGLNGLAAVLVSFDAPAAAGEARLDLYFHNDLHLAAILAAVGGDPMQAAAVFPVRGGHRVRAGSGPGEIATRSVAAGPTAESLTLVLSPIGDYSTYVLEITFDPARIDPFFAEIGFKFRPGCFTGACAPDWAAGAARVVPPKIDYLAKDFASFRHTLMTAMADRVPGWQPSSEADLDQALIGLFAGAADELSDYQDRVMAEAYLGRARKRVSIARHARLMDYHVHQGQQATAWVWLEIAEGFAPFVLPQELIAYAGDPTAEVGTTVFATREAELPPTERTELSPGYNQFHLHTWSGAHPALRAGATTADLRPAPTLAAPAGLITPADLRDAILDRRLARLLIEERLNPLTGRLPGRDPGKRQLLRLLPDAEVIDDPVEGVEVVRVKWDKRDALTHDYAFAIDCPDGPVDNVSVFRGNLVMVHHGQPVTALFYEAGAVLPPDIDFTYHRHFERPALYGEERGPLCRLPALPLAYRATERGGEEAARSSLRVTVEEPGGAINLWDERPSLVFSDDSAEEGDHFVVETDERQRSVLRFGNGVNGRLLPRGAEVVARYQVGGGVAGNVGVDAIKGHAPLGGALAGAVAALSNPFDVTDGADPEPVAEILRAAPEAYRARQLRAVTLADYVRRAEEVDGVSRAAASYAWTGSWRTVRLVVDPEGTTELSAQLADAVAAHLEAVRLIGEDIELRPPRFVPLTLVVSVCLTPDVWPEDLRFVIEQELSDSYTPDGRRGLFHPDEWTFGMALDRSQIAARLHAIPGIEHVVSITMRRFDAATGGAPDQARLEAAFDEIFLVENDPDHLERGSIALDLKGGRQ